METHSWVTQSTAQEPVFEYQDSYIMDFSAQRHAVLNPGIKHIPQKEYMENSC